jgi:DNA-directed RNA polymerase sigma subunit (sigma70/sigma32)
MADMVRANQRVERLARELDEARRDLRRRILAAHSDGESIAEIGRQLGVTRSRVYQLLEQAERDE